MSNVMKVSEMQGNNNGNDKTKDFVTSLILSSVTQVCGEVMEKRRE